MDVRRNTSATCSPRGFTLIEMLVVVVIIGILAGLVSVAAIRAQGAARIAEIRLEISTLEQGLEAFKSKYGDYPPDFTNEAAAKQFIARAWPRADAATLYSSIPDKVKNPASALCFWLGGINGEGFNSNSRTPFVYNSGSMTGAFFDFKADRVLDANFGEAEVRAFYYPPNASADTQPYVYFKAGSNGYFKATDTPKFWDDPATSSSVRSGRKVQACFDIRAGAGKWAKPKSFQIRAPGMDGIHGNESTFPGPFTDDYQYDDIANFSDGTFEDTQ